MKSVIIILLLFSHISKAQDVNKDTGKPKIYNPSANAEKDIEITTYSTSLSNKVYAFNNC